MTARYPLLHALLARGVYLRRGFEAWFVNAALSGEPLTGAEALPSAAARRGGRSPAAGAAEREST